MTHPPSAEFLNLSARCGQNPLRVQGPGGNTSAKSGDTMWIKASGTELADAEVKPIFVEVDLAAARAEATGAGDGSCKDTVIDPAIRLRPSIETTFHAILDWAVVVHTHSIATLTHMVGPTGLAAARQKLDGLPFASVPYRKPGLPLTREIIAQITPETQIILLANHGLIVAGADVAGVAALMEEVETRLSMPPLAAPAPAPETAAPEGYDWHPAAARLAMDPRLTSLSLAGSYYPDHVVFLGPALPQSPVATSPALMVPGQGIAVKHEATPAQRAMVQCLSDLLTRLPPDWEPDPIGPEAEQSLLNWDAEKYRQALAAR
ncbi:class II aldolase [Rhodophyticola sp. CCM32]|uniref:class II aldolase/adducin family protein n=1 Tax=Rhodophyticola sp. CCM32 TaxID=2916397 RepID=UPI00107EFFB8|nr:class II aldolase/adducin family protein [Rhodophyticola sp. CCM32]QBY00483.1 class II aldolase [Rhodophyticola sp. CCM32]